MMKKINIVILPYRGMDFFYKYGLAVRDIQMMAAIIESETIHKVTIIERPLTIYEKIINIIFPRSKSKGFFSNHKVDILRKISFDLIGPLLGRSWTENCYNGVYKIDLILEKKYLEGYINVVLDFTPIAKIDVGNKWLYWYDLIDNFSKHNRFSDKQKRLVLNKYDQVKLNARLVTGVSAGAIQGFNNSFIVHNAVGVTREFDKNLSFENKKFDFGFIGFVTDKFDTAFVKYLSSLGYSIVVYGDLYDKNIGKSLENIKNVTLKGSFHSSEIPELLKTFKIGMIPYIKSKMHDESPLKLYQYLQAGMPVLTSAEYDLSDKFIIEYNLERLDGLDGLINDLLIKCTSLEVINHIRGLIGEECFWDFKIKKILKKISEEIGSNE